jgi:hypothetical protein
MLDDDSMVTGQPVTVLSGNEGRGIPREVNVRDGQAESMDMQVLNGK